MGNGKSVPKGERDAKWVKDAMKEPRSTNSTTEFSQMFARKTCNQSDISGQLPTARNDRVLLMLL